eukprot:2665716-Prymnesium_polylepis.1
MLERCERGAEAHLDVLVAEAEPGAQEGRAAAEVRGARPMPPVACPSSHAARASSHAARASSSHAHARAASSARAVLATPLRRVGALP